jgi:glutathione S-transferase
MDDATLIISSKNYSSWSLRGWLLLRMSGLPFVERPVAADDAAARDELLLRASSIRVPCLLQMLPAEHVARARCRSISGEMHSGFEALRSSLPMNLRAHRPGFVVWSAARADIERICTIWRECLATWHGPWLFGERRSVADAMYAPVATRFLTYDVKLDDACAGYCARTMSQPDMVEWVAAARTEAEEVLELEVEF